MNFTPFSAIVIMLIIVVVLSSIQFMIAFLNQDSNKDLLNKVSVSTQQTNELLSSSRNAERIINEIRFLQNASEELRQNQTKTFLPALVESFKQTDLIQNVVQNLSEIFADQRFTAKNTRDIQLRMEADLDRIRNATDTMKVYVDFLRSNFNESMLDETYKEYAATHQMNDKLSILLNNSGIEYDR